MINLRPSLYLFAAGLLSLAACKKDKTSSVTTGSDECVNKMTASNGDTIAGKYIVTYSPNAINGRTASGRQLSDLGKTVLERNAIQDAAMIEAFNGEPGGFIAKLDKSEVERLEHDAAIQMVEQDRVVSLAVCFTVAEPRLITWNIQRVGYGNGIGKRAWIIDTGIDFGHPDLTVDVAKSKSFLTDNTSADDENGHGTHVAGIIGGKNNTFGVLGVASGATLVSLRVLDKDGSGTMSSIIQALGYVNTNGVAGDVVNLSLGEDVTSPTLNQQVQNTAARGIFIAIAAGNESQPARNTSPANASGANIYTVSAIDSLDHFASFSNYGNDVVDYAEPGVRILSTYYGGRYAYMSGTSMAAPHLAGLLLLKGNGISTSGFALNDPDETADPIGHF
jgi:subtilisin